MGDNRLTALLSGAGDQGSRPDEPWDDAPMPLGYRASPLPTDALGPILGPLVRAIEDAYQVPADLPINLALPLITTAVRGQRIVRINRDWTEVLALATLSALASGERKSPVLRVLDTPLREFERAAQIEAAPRIAEQAGRRKIAEDRAEALKKQAVRAVGIDRLEADNSYIEAVRALEEDDLKVDPVPRLLVDDITPESLDQKLGDHGAIGAISSEPGLFSILAGRYSGSANVENVLKATSGDSFTVDRVGRGEVIRVERPALSIAMCIQPGRLTELNATAVFRAAGLLARLMFVLPDPRVGTRQIRPELVPGPLVTAWAEHLTKLAEARCTDELQLDPGALESLQVFRAELEPTLHPHHGSLASIADWGSKLPGTIVRIAGALELLSDPYAPSIGTTTMENAIRLGRAYTSHALVAFGTIHAKDDQLTQARDVLGWLQVHVPRLHAQNAQKPSTGGSDEGSVPFVHAFGEFKLRDVMVGLRGRSWVESAEDVRTVLTVLADRGHIRRLANEPGQPGRPSERYQLHPVHLATDTTVEPDPASAAATPLSPPITQPVSPRGLPVWDED